MTMPPSWCRERGRRQGWINSRVLVLVLLVRRSGVMAQRISGSLVTLNSRFDTTKGETKGEIFPGQKYLAWDR